MLDFFITRWWRSIDKQVVVCLIILASFSVLLVTTAGIVMSRKLNLSDQYFIVRQLFYLVIAAVTIIFLSSLKIVTLKRCAIVGFIISFLLLVIVQFYGYEVKGARRWLNLGVLSIQPSEFIKPFFSVVVAWMLSLKYSSNFPGFLVSLFIYCLVMILLVLQPDFGMIIMMSLIFGVQLFISGIALFWVISALIVFFCGVAAAYLWLPHVTRRIDSFLNPSTEDNYQIQRSIEAFQYGGLYGTGPGEGRIKNFLPDLHTDFIFAVAGEEFGTLLCLVIIALFLFIILKIILKTLWQENKFTQLAIIGIISQFGMQAIINIGVTLHLLPTKGMTLPLISYGGSSTLSTAVAFGMLLGFTKRQPNNYDHQLTLRNNVI